VRAREWSPELGVFLSIDEYEFHDRKSTLWGWPNQNPVRFDDPTGRETRSQCLDRVKAKAEKCRRDNVCPPEGVAKRPDACSGPGDPASADKCKDCEFNHRMDVADCIVDTK